MPEIRWTRAVFELGAAASDPRLSGHAGLDAVARLVAEAVGVEACALTLCTSSDHWHADAVGLAGPWSESERRRFIEQTRWQPKDRVLLTRLLAEPEAGIRTRSELIADAEFRRTRLYNEFQRPLGIGNQAAGLTHENGLRVLIGLGRVESERPVDRRTIEGANWLAGHIARACAAVWKGEPDWVATLPPQCRRVLHLVDAGLDDHQIADELGITYHTARAHLKRVFRAAGVRSRLHLMQRYRADAVDGRRRASGTTGAINGEAGLGAT